MNHEYYAQIQFTPHKLKITMSVETVFNVGLLGTAAIFHVPNDE